MTYVEVAVSAPINESLTYSIPESLVDDGENTFKLSNYIGRRVLVPLGKRRVTGYILGAGEKKESDTYTVRPISKILDSYPLFHINVVGFFRWLSKYYHYPIGLVVKAALPGGLAPKSSKILKLLVERDVLLNGFVEDCPQWILDFAQQKTFPAGKTKLCLQDKNKRKILNNLIEEGKVAIAEELQRDSVASKSEICYSISTKESLPPKELSLEKSAIAEYRKDILESFGLSLKISEAKALSCLYRLTNQSNRKNISLRDLKKIYKGIHPPLDLLEEKSLVEKTAKRIYRSPFGNQLPYYPKPENLTPQQQEVFEKIRPEIFGKKFHPFLLHGVTGCGKTEVYLRCAEQTIESGRGVIVIVPEIALATQLEAQFVSRFGDRVVILHSGLSSAQKYDQYCLALAGKAEIVIGARSAIFAPLADPGLIIVDEEHEASFKQDDSFHYHGRDIAIVRGKIHNSVVILGSATPSVKSYNNAKIGKYTLLQMDQRVGDSRLPKVTIVDINAKNRKQPTTIIGTELLAKMRENKERNKQSILLLNRRGFSASLICKDCGTPVQCEHCNVSLTLHKRKDKLLCHYCGFTQQKNPVCVECRSFDLAPAGIGIERVEEEVSDLMPEADIMRLDSDIAVDRKQFISVLSKMHNREIDILIGTQMIAKGHHFPHVTLVGVVWADGGMSLPDYKAAERTFQLLTQVTGRAGRGESPGEVVIQTMRPDHYVIEYAKNHCYESFYDHELKLRERPAFPPFVRLVLIRIRGKVEEKVRLSGVAVARFSRKMIVDQGLGIEVLGPVPAPLDKIKDNYRWQILFKGYETVQLHHLCKYINARVKELLSSTCSLTVDVDPENMM